MRLVTAIEVIETSLTNGESFDTALIKDEIINAAQLRFIMPKLGDELWDELVTEGDAGSYSAVNTTLVNKLKPAMCFFVKYEIIPDSSVNQTSAGLQVLNTEFSTAATDSQRGQIREQALTHGNTLLKEVIRWLEKSENVTNYPLYTLAQQNDVSPKSTGGIIF